MKNLGPYLENLSYQKIGSCSLNLILTCLKESIFYKSLDFQATYSVFVVLQQVLVTIHILRHVFGPFLVLFGPFLAHPPTYVSTRSVA